MKKILLFLVGGTICTKLNEKGTLSVSGEAGTVLTENFRKSDSAFAGKVQFVTTENMRILSENMTVKKWNEMIEMLRLYLKNDRYDGIIFAHGTDTLAYSASLFSMILSGTETPVFFVSSNARPDSDRANGNDNFRCAVECICRGIQPDIYVPYRNISDGKMYIHMASRLKQCQNYSEDFDSVGKILMDDFTEGSFEKVFAETEEKYPCNKVKKAVDLFGKWELSECVLMITPYVGLNYEAFSYDRYKAVLHGTFHSGTACAEKTEASDGYGENSVLRMLDICAECGTDVYISPSRLSGEIYETQGIIGAHRSRGKGAEFICGCTTEAAYAKLLLAYSLKNNEDEIKSFIETDFNFEYFC